VEETGKDNIQTSFKDEGGSVSKLEEKGEYSLQTRCDGDAVSRLEMRCTLYSL
jgi:hypothetical protein